MFATGSVVCFGSNETSEQTGQLGRVWGTSAHVGQGCTDCSALSTVTPIVFSNTSQKAIQVAAGKQHSCGNDLHDKVEHFSSILFFFLSHNFPHPLSLVLFWNGKSICFGSNSVGQTGAGTVANVSGPSNASPPDTALATLPYISFLDDTLEITSLAVGQFHSCVLRCDRTLVCFGSGANGEIGQVGTANRGDTDGAVAALNPVPFDSAKITLVPLAITSITLSTGETIVTGPCRLAYVTSAIDMDFVSVTAVVATPGSTVTVNGGAMSSTSVPLYRHLVNAVVVKATLGSATVEVFVNVRLLSSTSIALSSLSTCVLLAHKVACFGVRGSS